MIEQSIEYLNAKYNSWIECLKTLDSGHVLVDRISVYLGQSFEWQNNAKIE